MSMMIKLLFTLTITGSTVVAFLLVLRFLLPNAISIKWHYRIRKMAIVFYLLPIAILIRWISALLTLHVGASVQVLGEWNSSVPPVSLWSSTPFSISADIAIPLMSIWGIGVIVFAVWQVYCYHRFLKKIQHTYTPVFEYSEIAKQLVLTKGALGIKRDVRLAYSAAVRSPVLIGLRKPTIYLPQKNNADLDMCMVLHHELIHLKRNDLWIKALMLAVNALHWFNPFVYVLRRDIHTWSELSCDEEVVKKMSYAERKRYGETLLNVMVGSKGLPVRFCSSLSGDGKKLKRRLNMMMDVKKIKKHALVITILMMLAIGGIGITASAMAEKHTPIVVDDNVEAKEEKLDGQAKEASGGSYELISVKRSDEKKFPPKEWEKVLKQIEKGEVYWEEENSSEMIENKDDEAIYDPNDQAKEEGK